MRVLVTGATGLLGSTLVPWLESCGHQVFAQGFAGEAPYRADLRDYVSTAALLERSAPECIVNLAALTNVDACERHPHDAYRLNVAGTEHLCRWIRTRRKTRCHLVQISTDQVYDGPGPHPETAVNIQNIYAFSKISAELVASSVSSSVLRTNFFGASRCSTRRSFSDWIVHSAAHNQVLNLFEDVLFSPLSMRTLCQVIERVVVLKPLGVFNVGGSQGLSKAQFAIRFAAAIGLSTASMRLVSVDTIGLQAHRPKDMRMDCGLFERTMGLRLPSVAEEITAIRHDYVETA